MFASGLYSKLSTKAVMFIQVALCSFSSPACVSLTLGYSEDSTSTLPAQFQVICWLHLKSTERCEVPDTRLLRGRTVSSRLQNSTLFCPLLRRSDQNPNRMTEEAKVSSEKVTPIPAYRLPRLRPEDGHSNKTQCLE